MLRRGSLAAAVAAALVVVGTLTTPARAVEASGTLRTESREVFAPDGTIDRVHLRHRVPDSPAPRAATQAAQVVPIEVNGPSESRLDLVFVGDGYTSGQLGKYGQHVRSKFEEIMSIEPFRSRRSQFNAWQVNVVSAQSGVDNDPSPGINRDTALDMYFWCADIERLLCVNETKAHQYAAAARDVDQVIALANSTMYGGAGGGVATASGDNKLSGQIAIHELGHSIGGLADEYDSGGGGCYTGGEPGEPNVSTYTAAQMQRDRRKWHRWLGQVSPDGGTVGTYEGAHYHLRCIYRPTDNSIMRTLGRQFNLPGREAMIAAFNRKTRLIEASGEFWVRPVGDFTVTWHVDGQPAGTGVALDVAALDLGSGPHTVTATVTDPDESVRDEALRAAYMTETITWTIP